MVACLHIMKEVSKLFVLVVCCLVLAYSAPLLDCDELDRYCQRYGTAWWRYRADYCFNCGDKVYHCARDYDNPDSYREGCAVEKNCSAGEEPHLSFIKNGQPLTEPVVYCNPCYDRNYFNRESRLSSTYSECPNEKRNDCSSGKHKIFCETEDLTDERYCRCDARKGFSPINDLDNVMCSYKDYECLDDFKCPNLQQMLLNYSCAAVCDEGYDRLSEDSDECLLKTTVATSQKPTTIIPPISERNKTPDSSRIPAPASTQIPICSEECDQFSTCHNGTCECLDDACSDPYEPVCGYDEKSQKYRTFNSSCELNRAYCRQKQFVFHSDGECKTAVPGETNNKSSTIIIIVAVCVALVVCAVLFLVICCYLRYIRRKQKDKSHPGPGNVEIIVPPPTSPESVDSTLTDVDDRQSKGRRTERQLSAPLSIEEDSSTPALKRPMPTIVYNTEHHYYGAHIQTRGGSNQIYLQDNNSKVKNGNITIKYNKEDVKEDDENVHLLKDGEAETEIREEPKPSSVIEESDKREVPVEVHKADDQFHDENNMPNLGRNDEVDNVTDGEDNTTKTTLLDEVKTGEVESEGKLVTAKEVVNNETLGQSHSRDLCRSTSRSHDSVFVAHTETLGKKNEQYESVTIIDASTLYKDGDEYKKLINQVMDKSNSYLVENMDPKSMVDKFHDKDIMQYIKRRDIGDLNTQTEKNREIIKKIRETGKQYYQEFKHCLKETKQDGCLAKVEQIQSHVIEMMKTKAALSESNGRDRNSLSSSVSLPHGLDSSCTPDVIGSFGDEKVSDESMSSTEKDVKMLKKVQSDEIQALKGNDRLPEACLPQPLEESNEKVANMQLNDIGSFLKNKGVFKTLNIHVDEIYKEFAEKCEEIRTNYPDLTAERLLLAGTQHTLESSSYSNIPSGFQACRSSGKENSCFYQSVSLLLTGSENSQCSLRLLATLYAVKSLGIYRKHLLCCNEQDLKVFFHSLIDEQTMKEFCEVKDVEAFVDICLKFLIMETACLGTDSSVLHVEFLSGALGIKIVQYFQHEAGYGKILETEPWARIIQAEETNNSLPLHIFWVNYSNTENGVLNHIVPLSAVGNVSQEIYKRVS